MIRKIIPIYFFLVSGILSDEIGISRETAITRAIEKVGPTVASINIEQHIRSLSFDPFFGFGFPQDIIPTTDAELDIQIGRIYKEAGQPEELKNRLKIAQKRKDISLQTQMYIGQIYMNEFKDYDAAIEHYENLFDEYPYIPDFLYTLVQAYAKAERRSEAVDVLELWLRSHPNDSQAIDWLSILIPPAQ